MIEDTKLTYAQRAEQAVNPAAKALFRLMESKKTNLCLSNDEIDAKRFLEVADQTGPYIAVLKSHIDIIRDFTPEVTKKLVQLSKKHNFMIFEDRKFADIGNTVKLQYSEGIYHIADWSSLVNVHIVAGPGIIQGIGEVMKGKNDGTPRGIVILAQMTPEGNLATSTYTKKGVEFANASKDLVTGYIGNGGDLKELKKLVAMSFGGHVIMTPGIQIQSKGDSMGQRYTLPEDAIAAGSDCLIVGRGIYKAHNPLEMAEVYRKAGWDAYLKRTGQ